MKRRRRSGVAETEAEVAQMTQAKLELDIQRCIWGFENGGTSQGRKAFYKRLVWLEYQRENLFGVPAQARRFSS